MKRDIKYVVGDDTCIFILDIMSLGHMITMESLKYFGRTHFKPRPNIYNLKIVYFGHISANLCPDEGNVLVCECIIWLKL